MPAPASSAHAAPRSSQPPAGRPFVLRLAVPPGTPRHHTPLTPVSFLLRAALVAPDARAIVHPQRRYGFTYAQWAARCLSLAFALRATPAFEPGTVVAVVAPNCPMILEAHHAVLAAAGIVQPINIRNSPAEISYVLEHSGARVVLVDSEFAALIEPKHAQRGTTIVVSHDSGGVLADDHHDPYEQFLDAGWQAWQRANRTSSASGRSPTLDWAHFSLPRSEDTPSSLCYTSGTTGRPKGVLTTVRGSYLAALANGALPVLLMSCCCHARSTRPHIVPPPLHRSALTRPCSLRDAADPSKRVPVDSPRIPLQRLDISVGHNRRDGMQLYAA